MKRNAKILSVLLMMTVFVFALTACGNTKTADTDKDGSKVEGNKEGTESKTDKASSKVEGNTYAFESYTLNGEDASQTIAALYKEQTFEFKADGVCVQSITWSDEMAATMGTDPVVMEGTYEESGDTVTVTFTMEGEEDTVMEFRVDSDTIKALEETATTVYRLK